MSSQFDILIVEDEQVVIDAAKKILIPEGFKVDAALNAEIALKKLQQKTYKLILSDLMLPNISGIELIKNIKSKKPRIPIIMVTGYATLENAVKSFKAGAFDFIPKPFDFEELVGVVFRAMNHIEMVLHPAMNKKKITPSNGRQPGEEKLGKYYFLGEHSWARLDQDGSTIFGVGQTFPDKMGEIQKIEFPPINAEVLQGNMCARITSQDHLIHMIWAPLSGKIIKINHKVEENTNLINTDPFYQGWLVKILPTNLESELENLTHYAK